MKPASALLALLLAAPAAGGAQPADDDRWVCVPTEQWGWRCGRGANAPEPASLPPAQPPEQPPEGYKRPDQAGQVPLYLLDPTLPRPRDDADGPSGADATASAQSGDPSAPGPTPEGPSAAAAAAGEREPDADAGPESPAAPIAGPRGSRDAAGTTAAGTTTNGVAVDAARYGIQLAAARDPGSLAAYRQDLESRQLDVYQRTWEDAGGTWHVLLTGRFATASAASRALAGLPDRVREAGAWIRPLESLQPASRQP